MDYTFANLKKAYVELGVEPGMVVMLKTDLRWLGAFEFKSKSDLLAAHLEAIAERLDLDRGTLIVPTASMSLCNTDKAFNPKETPSEMGLLTEYIRQQPGTVRSFHPFVSYTALGKDAERVCGDVSRHAYGPRTPEARALEMDALEISVGLHPRKSASLIHHIEQTLAVPYRYTKEYIHPVVRGESQVSEPFYMYVWYRDSDIVRDNNKKIFDHFFASGGQLRGIELGRGKLFSYRMADFNQHASDFLHQDIYGWLAEPPQIRPWQR
jgi:aminoglycoside 3-N-acetyltransferase